MLTGSQYSRSASVTNCYEARVNPSSLKMSRARLTACDNVVLDEATVAPFVSTVKVGYGELRIGRLVSQAGAVKLGPVLASYQFDSGTHLEWVYGPGSLWLYEEGTAQGPRVFRVSTTTGQLLQSTPVPRFVRPLITADANGLYVAGAGSFGGTGSTLIYRVAPSAKSAQSSTAPTRPTPSSSAGSQAMEMTSGPISVTVRQVRHARSGGSMGQVSRRCSMFPITGEQAAGCLGTKRPASTRASGPAGP